MKMKRIAIRFVAGLFLAAAVLSPAHADEHREDIIKLVEMTGTLQIVDQMMTATVPQLLDLLHTANPSIPDTVMREFKQVIESEFRMSLPEMLDVSGLWTPGHYCPWYWLRSLSGPSQVFINCLQIGVELLLP